MPEIYGSQADFARFLESSEAYITKMKKAGRLVFAPDGRRIDFERSIARIKATSSPSHVNTSKTAKEKLSPVIDAPTPIQQASQTEEKRQERIAENSELEEEARQLKAAQREEKEYAAKLKQLAYEKELGTLVYKEDVEKYIAKAIKIARDKLLSFPSKLSPRLTVETDQKTVYAILEKETHDVIEEIQSGMADYRG